MNEIALFESALRAAVPTRPDPVAGQDLVRRLASVARSATLEAETQVTRRAARAPARRRSRLALVAKIAIAVALIPLALAGLAVAGVNLPQPARDAFDSIGVNLPNQASDQAEKAAPATNGNDVSGAATAGPSATKGNSAVAHRHAREQRKRAKGKAVGHTRGKAIGLNEATPPGQDGSAGNSSNAGSPPHSNSGQGATGSAPSGHSSSGNVSGGGPSHPFPSQAHGRALGRSK